MLPHGPRLFNRIPYQLHGSGDDHQSRLTNSNIARDAGPYRRPIVMPDGGSSDHLDDRSYERRGRQRYADLLMDDLSRNVAATFRVADGPCGIGGLSMGSFGAARLGLKDLEGFASVRAHSGSFAEMPELDDFIDGDDASVATVASRLAAQPERPVIACHCDIEDRLMGPNRAFAGLLDRLAIPHRYPKHPGAHDWDYRDQHVRAALAQHGRVLISPRTSTEPWRHLRF